MKKFINALKITLSCMMLLASSSSIAIYAEGEGTQTTEETTSETEVSTNVEEEIEDEITDETEESEEETEIDSEEETEEKTESDAENTETSDEETTEETDEVEETEEDASETTDEETEEDEVSDEEAEESDEEDIMLLDLDDDDPTNEIKDCSQVGDGKACVVSTSTEYDTLNEAMAAADTTDTIYLGAGTYSGSDDANKGTGAGKNLTFVGKGEGSTYWNILSDGFRGGGDGYVDYSFDNRGSSSPVTVTFKNMSISTGHDLKNSYISRDNGYLQGLVGIDNIVLENCTFTGIAGYWGYTSTTFNAVTFNAPGYDQTGFWALISGNYALYTYTGSTYNFNSCTFNTGGKAIKAFSYAGSDCTINFNNCKENASYAYKTLLDIDENGNGSRKYFVNFTGDYSTKNVNSNSTTCSRLFQFNSTKDKTTVTIDGTTVWANGAMVSHEVDLHDGHKYTDGYKDNAYTTTYSDWTVNADGTFTRTVKKICNYCGWSTTYNEVVSGKTYQVIYDANGTDLAPAYFKNADNTTSLTRTDTTENIRDTSHEFTIISEVPTREGYSFLGWATSADGEVVYSVGDKITLNEENPTTTLYAVWKQESYGNVVITTDDPTITQDASKTSYDVRYTATYTMSDYLYNRIKQSIDGISNENTTLTFTVKLDESLTVKSDGNGYVYNFDSPIFDVKENGIETIDSHTLKVTCVLKDDWKDHFDGYTSENPMKMTLKGTGVLSSDKFVGNGTLSTTGSINVTVVTLHNQKIQIDLDANDCISTMIPVVVPTPTPTVTPDPTPTPTVNPGCPTGLVWDEETQTCASPTPTPTVNPNPVPVNPTPTTTPTPTPSASAEATVEPTATPSATSAPVVINDEDTPLAPGTGSWALINLISAIVTVVLAVVLVLSKHTKDDDEEEDENTTTVVTSETEDDEEQVTRKRIWKVVSVLIGIISVVVFILTENMKLPMVLVDKWTILMIILALLNVVTLYFGRKWHKDDDDDEEQELSHSM